MIGIYVLLSVWILIASFVRKSSIIFNSYWSYFLCLMLSFLIGISVIFGRSLEGGDIERYIREYLIYGYLSLSHAYSMSSREPAFFLLQWVLAQLSNNPQFFVGSVYIIFLLIFIKALRKIFSRWQLVFVFFTYTNFFIFYGYINVVIRHGLAIALLLLAIGYYLNNNKKRFLICLGLSPLFHASGIIGLMLLFLKHIKMSYLVWMWLVSVVMLFLGVWEWIIPQLLGPTFIESYLQSYTDPRTADRYAGGTHRIDFVIFSGFWLVSSLMAYKYLIKNDFIYEYVIKTYICFNTMFIILGFLAYSDRIASYSWFLIPIMVWYPVFRVSKNQMVMSFAVLSIAILTGVITGTVGRFVQFGWGFY